MRPGDEALRERLLGVMDGKHHVGWRAFTLPGLTRAQLAIDSGVEVGVEPQPHQRDELASDLRVAG